jgi:hypothetical protein
MEKISATGYRGVTRGRTKKDGTPRYVATHSPALPPYIGSYSTAFEAARHYDWVAWMWRKHGEVPRLNFPPIKYERRPCMPGTTLRDMIVAKARHAMLNAPTRFEQEALLRKSVRAG